MDFFLFHDYNLRTAWNTLFWNVLSVDSSPFQLAISFSGLSPLTCYTHMILIKSICKAIKDYSVLQRSLSHFYPSSHVNDMRSLQEGILRRVRSFISLVHNTARQLKRQTPALWLQVDTPNPGSPLGSLLHLYPLVSPSWPVHVPSSGSPRCKCFLSIDQINRLWGHMATGPLSYQAALGGSQSHFTASKRQHHSQHRKLASPSTRHLPLLRHQITIPSPFLNTALSWAPWNESTSLPFQAQSACWTTTFPVIPSLGFLQHKKNVYCQLSQANHSTWQG